jgi:hypothetical protein
MALTKTITQPSTVVTDYHRIQQIISLVWTNDGGRAELWGETYATADARANGAAPVDRPRYDCELTQTEAAAIKSILYRAVRRAHMPDATDHIEADDVEITEIVGMFTIEEDTK